MEQNNGGNMSVPKFKRQPSEYDYVNNAYELNVEIMNLVSKLSARWAHILFKLVNFTSFFHKQMLFKIRTFDTIMLVIDL